MGPKEISITSKVWIIFFAWYHYVHLIFITIPIQMVKHISQQTFLKDLCKKYPAGALTIYFKILCWYSFNMTKVNRCKCNIFSFFWSLEFFAFCKDLIAHVVWNDIAIFPVSKFINILWIQLIWKEMEMRGSYEGNLNASKLHFDADGTS